jgi:hypothetical protein
VIPEEDVRRLSEDKRARDAIDEMRCYILDRLRDYSEIDWAEEYETRPYADLIRWSWGVRMHLRHHGFDVPEGWTTPPQ